jgi:2-polyprenyl-6-methoxyphenol hydroxylase-like FAD-dependent oxidoreductase
MAQSRQVRLLRKRHRLFPAIGSDYDQLLCVDRSSILPDSLPAKRRNRRAVIIGGSMSGLFTAAFLRKIGWQADVYERSGVELVGRGAGITAHPELLESLQQCGAGIRKLGVDVEKRIALDRAGCIIAEKCLPQILTSWDRLQRLLRATIDPAHYHLGWNFERVEQNGSGVRVHFSGGRVEHGDILVGGDGIRSSVRSIIMPEVQPIYAGYYIWRGAPSEAQLSPRALNDVFPYFSFFLPPQQQVLGYPIAGLNNELRPGHRRFNFIWYRVASAALLADMCVDDNGRKHEHSVPPPLVRKDLVAALREEADDALPAVLNECLRAIDKPFFTPVYDFIAPRIVSDRVVLVGDAASNARPHMGFGVSKAGCDAQALAETLHDREDIEKALAEYNRVRQPIGEIIVKHSRRLGTYMGVNLQTDEDCAMHQLLQDPRAMMDSIAAPNFLAAYR